MCIKAKNKSLTKNIDNVQEECMSDLWETYILNTQNILLKRKVLKDGSIYVFWTLYKKYQGNLSREFEILAYAKNV